MGHEEQGVTNRPTDSDPVGPKHKRSHIDPLGVFIIAGFHEGFMDVEVLPLDNTICLGIVRRNLDVMDAIFLGQVTSHRHECRTIVSNNFSDSTPSTKDVLEYKISESLLIFLPKGMPFGPRRHGTMSLDEIAKLVHGVRNRFPTRLKSKEVEVEQEITGKETVKAKLSSRAVVKEQGLGDVCLHKRRNTQIET